MSKYFLNEYDCIWQETLQKVLRDGTKLCYSGSNWELWLYEGMIYSIPIVSGCRPSYWCSVRKLQQHLFHLRQIQGYKSIIPPGWKDVNCEVLKQCGIAA